MTPQRKAKPYADAYHGKTLVRAPAPAPGAGGLFAQQDPQFTQYMFNLLALNPAYAGSAERVSIKGLTRHQWVGFEGAP